MPSDYFTPERENSIWNIVMLVISLQFSIFSCRGCGRGHNLTEEKNEMLHPWHYKRSRSSKRSPLPYSHSQWYWHLVFLWSFALIKKKRKKNSCHGCNWSVFVSCELVVVYVAFFFNVSVYSMCVFASAHLHQGNETFEWTISIYIMKSIPRKSIFALSSEGNNAD